MFRVYRRAVDDLVKAMGMSGISKSQVSRLCAEIDERVNAFLDRPLEGDWPYLWLDSTFLKLRRSGRIVSKVTGGRSTQPTPWNGSTRKSNAVHMSSASSPTKPPSPDWLER